ncbi:CPBP family intramembrane glutamic endopeptidase [Actinoplanes sp. NPDC051343]|uniref:CPBP family intramembrane glutamic endopeptidase n=1 Tax=Actinoplanes sp. NPDC051343 TaxID=3363906 RepID=UPI0037A176DD
MRLALTAVLLVAFFLVRGRAPLITGPVFAVLFLMIGGCPVGGVGWAAGCLVLTVLGYAAALLIPFTRRLFRDPRYRMPLGRALYTALIAVPLSTVAVEEAAFRGALWPVAWATPLLFGLWHVLPGTRANAAAPNRWATFAFTFAAGVVFALLRHFSGGLLAPFVLHWAANGLGVVASSLNRSDRRE